MLTGMAMPVASTMTIARSTRSRINAFGYALNQDGKNGHSAAPDKMPELPKENAPDKNAKITQLQVVPAEVTLDPGQTITFKVRGFDADGRGAFADGADVALRGDAHDIGRRSAVDGVARGIALLVRLRPSHQQLPAFVQTAQLELRREDVELALEDSEP